MSYDLGWWDGSAGKDANDRPEDTKSISGFHMVDEEDEFPWIVSAFTQCKD